MKRGLNRKEIVLGYMTRGLGEDDRVVLNPARDALVTPGPLDMVVVVSER
jgi:hypothetical protein